MTSFPNVTFQNNLGIPVVIYDSFNNGGTTQNLANYFGTLTNVGTAAAGATTTLAPIHGPISVYIIYDTKGNPISRLFTMGSSAQTFQINQSDVDIITATTNFFTFLTQSPNDPVATSFQTLIKGGKATPAQINSFFQSSANYKSCTYISYMLVMTTLARNPSSASQPVEQKSYSLSSLCSYLGVSWPSGFPDISVTNFSCSDNNDVVQLGGTVDIKNITFDSGVLPNILSFLPSSTAQVEIIFDYAPGLAFTNTTLQFILPNITIPTGGSSSMKIDQPTIMLNISPLFKFVVFEVKATIPFSLFSSPTFNADISMTIDNVEASVGVVLENPNASLLTPPVMKGVHFDQIGVGMGLFFEPPGLALGVEGAFHIGDSGNVVTLDDDTFAVVCEMEEEVPNPLYISFYVPQMNLDQIVTIFTNSSCNINFPISASDLSFKWVENLMEPVVLPDGSLAQPGYCFSANVDFFGLSFYGDVEVDLNNGLSGIIEMSPFSLGGIFNLSGNGKGVSIKVDANGNPIKNNYIPKTAAEKAAVQNATTKQIVPAGGPEMTISTSSSPYFTLGANLKFLGFNDSVQSTVDNNGISFELDFGSIISTKMGCVLKDYQNFSGNFSYGPNFSIPLPLGLGSIPLTATIGANLGLTTSPQIGFSVGGNFDFEGLTRNIGPVSLDLNIGSISDVLSEIENWIISNVKAIFSDIIGDVSKWANAVYTNVIAPVGKDVMSVVNVFKNTFGQSVQEIGNLLKGSTYALVDVANAMRNAYQAAATDVTNAMITAYNATMQAAASALQQAGYAANEVASALSSAYGATANAVAVALQQAGYAVNDIAKGLSIAYGATASVVASALQQAGYGINDVSSALSSIGSGASDAASAIASVFGAAPSVVSSALQQAGYAANDISNAFQSLGGDFASFGNDVAHVVTHDLNPSNW